MQGSLRAYARHRAQIGLTGATLGAVQKALASRRIERLPDGRIDFEQADQTWERKSDHRQQRRPKPPRLADRPLQTDESAVPISAPSDSDGDFWEAQRRHEWLKVQERDLELQVRRGELVEFQRVNRFIGTTMLRAAEILDRLPDELADRLAQTPDPVVCKELLRAELTRARSQLAEYRPDAAA